MQKNKEIISLYKENYRKNNKEKISIGNRIYRLKNKNILNLKQKKRKNKDINFKLACNLRNRLGKAIKFNYKIGSAIKDLGCTIKQLKQHLQNQFQKGMTWNNWAPKGWHIDHIIPLCQFDLSNREEFLKANHYTNLQPLWVKEHNIKSSIERQSISRVRREIL